MTIILILTYGNIHIVCNNYCSHLSWVIIDSKSWYSILFPSRYNLFDIIFHLPFLSKLCQGALGKYGRPMMTQVLSVQSTRDMCHILRFMSFLCQSPCLNDPYLWEMIVLKWVLCASNFLTRYTLMTQAN